MVFGYKALKSLILVSLMAIGLMVFPTGDIGAVEQVGGVNYITSRAELVKALSDKQEVIYVGDIEFDENDIYIQIEQSATFIGKPEGSVFRKGVFLISGPDVESELIDVSFEKITFDGCYVSPEGDPNNAVSFDAFHGDRTGKGCFTVNGFVRLNVKDCCIKNYCSKYGAGMYFQYTDGNADLGTRAKIGISGCTFSGNICEKGVFWCNGKKTSLEMTDCSFTGNYAYTGIVMLGGIKGTVENVTVKDNNRVIFKEKNSFPSGGGGISIANSDAVIKNCLIEGNSAPHGGGILATASKVTIDSCRILNNTADSFGGGMALYSSETAPIYVTNCLISGNQSKEEGGVWVGPADQIGAGVPTGVVEFSFCTIEGNISDDEEHLKFHPVMLENAESTIGRDGKIDFIACRINDPKVSHDIKSGENYNIINSDKKGASVPPDVVGRIANGYYNGKDKEMYPGMNEQVTEESREKGNKTGSQNLAIAICAICGALLAGVAFFVLRSRDRAKAKLQGSGNAQKEMAEKNPELGIATSKVEGASDDGSFSVVDSGCPVPGKTDLGSAEDIESDEGIAAKIEEISRNKMLTGRETVVLREYVSGKSRSEISETLYISESTVKNHISNIFSKLCVKNKEELMKLIKS